MKHRFFLNRESVARMKSFGEENETLRDQDVLPESEQPVSGSEAPADSASYEAAFRTDVGLVRLSNQDTPILEGVVFGVADGMGGHNGGEIASACTREALLQELNEHEPDEVFLAEAVERVNTAVYQRSLEDEALEGMGTTLTVLWLGEKHAFIAQVGDSRCYRLRDGELEQLTDDHSIVMDLVRAGILTRDQAAHHPMRNVITRAIGTDEAVTVDTRAEERVRGDLYLLCSDGLYGMMEEDELKDILCSADDLESAADRLLKAALDGGGRDNVTLVLLRDLEGSHE